MMVSLIIPTLNERESIALLCQKLKEVYAALTPSHTLELIFVDDGSTDGTREFLKTFQGAAPMPLTLIERDVRGLATAVLEGFGRAQGDVLGVIDADLSHPPELIRELLAQLDNADVAVASRNLPGGGVEEWPMNRKSFSKCATLLAKPLAAGVTDPMSGFFFVKRHVIEGVALSPVGYKILLEILVKGRHKEVREVAYMFRNRDLGKSKLNWKVTLAYFWHLIKLYWWKLTH